MRTLGAIVFNIILLSFFGRASAQNLVNRPGFEAHAAPPNNHARICRATGWSSLSCACSLIVGTGSPEFYLNACSGGADPPATYRANLMPRSIGGMSATTALAGLKGHS